MSEKSDSDRILQFFDFGFVPERLKAVCKPYRDMAHLLAVTLPRNDEREAALRKLLESKDAAERSYKADP